MENIEYRELTVNEINNDILDYYNRYQESKKFRINENGKLVIKEVEYIENWDKTKKIYVIKEFEKAIKDGGSVFAAYENNKIIGFATLINKIFGSKKQYIQLRYLHISSEYRNKGIGKKLFGLCIKKTKEKGVEKIYIAANPAQETQEFYLSIGCVDAEEPNKALAEKDPYERQMEYTVT